MSSPGLRPDVLCDMTDAVTEDTRFTERLKEPIRP